MEITKLEETLTAAAQFIEKHATNEEEDELALRIYEIARQIDNEAELNVITDSDTERADL